MITDLRTISNFFFTHIKFVTNLSLFEGSRRTPKSNLWTTPEMGFVRDEMNKHYELNRGVRRLLTRCGLHKFHWSWWGWFNFSCTKRERTNDWATRTRGFVMERECKSIFPGCAKKVKVVSSMFNNIQLLCRESILTCSSQRWTGQFCDLVIKQLYKRTLRQHTFYRNWSLWDRGLIYCIYHWKEESARKRVSAFPFACRQIDSDIWFFQGMMISPYVSLYLVTVYLTTCHRNWLGRLKPGKWNDFETKWNTSTNKHRDKYPKTHIVDLF